MIMRTLYIIYDKTDEPKIEIIRGILKSKTFNVEDAVAPFNPEGVYLFVASKKSNSSTDLFLVLQEVLRMTTRVIPVKIDSSDYSNNIEKLLSLIDYVDLSDLYNTDAMSRLLKSVSVAVEFSVEDNIFYKANKEISSGDKELGIELLIKAAESGDCYAQTTLGVFYLFGDSLLPQNSERAEHWLSKASLSEVSEAEMYLGLMLRTDNYTHHDYLDSYYYLHKSADAGNLTAMRELGKTYLGGIGIPRDAQKAVYWLTKAADSDDVEAQYLLGDNYYYGEFFPKNLSLAVEWLKKAAGNNDKAKFLLGKCYLKGDGVEKDIMLCYKLWIEAARNGEPQSQCGMGHLLCGGEVIGKDFSAAASWLRKANAQGYHAGDYLLKELEQYGY